MADAVSHTARMLESLGHRVEEADVDLGLDWEQFVLANTHLWTANLTATIDELAAALGRPKDASTLEPVTLARYHYGQRVSGTQLVTALAARNRVARGLPRVFETYDALLTPTTPELPPPAGELAEGADELDGLGWIRRVLDRSPFTTAFNVAGTPAMTVPSPWTPGRDCRSACSSPPGTRTRDACSASPPGWSTPAPGRAEPPRCGREPTRSPSAPTVRRARR